MYSGASNFMPGGCVNGYPNQPSNCGKNGGFQVGGAYRGKKDWEVNASYHVKF